MNNVLPPLITGVSWSKTQATVGETVSLTAKLAGIVRPSTVTFGISEYVTQLMATGGGYRTRQIAAISIEVEGGALEAIANWTVAIDDDGLTKEGIPAYRFHAWLQDNQRVASPFLSIGSIEQLCWLPLGSDSPPSAATTFRQAHFGKNEGIGLLIKGNGLEGFHANFQIYQELQTLDNSPNQMMVDEIRDVPVAEGEARAQWNAQQQATRLPSGGSFSFTASLNYPGMAMQIKPQKNQSQNSACKAECFNAYIYVVGTDGRGQGDFNEMRKVIDREIQYEVPWVSITFDYKKGELRKTFNDGRKSENQSFGLGPSIKFLYNDLIAMGNGDYKIRQLHFLTHAYRTAPQYHPSARAGASVQELEQTFAGKEATVRRAFAPDAVVKIHGCSNDPSLRMRIREFCQNKDQASRNQFLQELRDIFKESYAFKLAQVINLPLWAVGMGTWAAYSCTYLPLNEMGKRFCVESMDGTLPDGKEAKGFQITLRFYAANYLNIFAGSTNQGIFDKTYHMRYLPQLATSSTPADCAAAVPPRGT